MIKIQFCRYIFWMLLCKKQTKECYKKKENYRMP